MDISVCIITRNECKNLEECLKKIQVYPVEIVVVDTGSTDCSVEVAKKYTDNVQNYEWCDDFSAARNFAAKKASNDLIVMIDTDEFIQQWDFDAFITEVKKNPRKVGRLHRKNQYVTDGLGMSSNELVNRVYDRRFFEYEGMIHEQIVSKDRETYETYVIPLYLDHSGYVGGAEERKRKAKRNLDLLLTMLQKQPDDTYVLYQIGKSYYYEGNYPLAVDYFCKCFDYPLDGRLEYVLDLVTTLGYAYINAGYIEQALVVESLYDDFCYSADFLFMLGNVYMQNARFEEAIHSFEQATEIPVCGVEGVNSYLANYNIGVIYECLNDKENALEYYQKANGYSLARQGEERIKSL